MKLLSGVLDSEQRVGSRERDKQAARSALLFVKQSEKFSKEENCERIHFCMEATGIYHCELCEYLQNSAHKVSVVNPVRTKAFSKSLQLRTKNDKVDSRMIAHFTHKHNPPQTPKVPKELQHFRSLVKFKETLVEDRSKELMRMKSSLDSDVKKMINKRINFLEKQIKETIFKRKSSSPPPARLAHRKPTRGSAV